MEKWPATQPASYSLSGSFRVYGDERYDYVAISLQEKLPYRSQMQVSPARIVVDIFGATSQYQLGDPAQFGP